MVVNPPRFSVGELVGITPKSIRNPISIIPKPLITKPLFVPHRFLSNRAILPNISAKYPEKYMINHPNPATTNPMIICFAIILLKK